MQTSKRYQTLRQKKREKINRIKSALPKDLPHKDRSYIMSVIVSTLTELEEEVLAKEKLENQLNLFGEWKNV